MTSSKKFLTMILTAFVAWLLPVFATAQMPGRGEFRQLRSDDPRCGTEETCFQVGAYRPGTDLSYERMLGVVNRGRSEGSLITMAQLEAANPCHVLYVRHDGDRVTRGVNGMCERNGTTERLTFDSFCRGATSCARWTYAGHVYHVPSERLLTPDERAVEMAREITNAAVTETVPAPTTLGANLRELIELRGSSQPPTDEHEVAVLTAMADALDRAGGIPASVSTPADMDFNVPVTGETGAGELEALRAQVRQLTQERDHARRTIASMEGGNGWLWLLVFSIVGMAIMFLIGRKTAPKTFMPLDPIGPSSDPETAKLKADRDQWRMAAQGAQTERDGLDGILVTIQKIVLDATRLKVDLRLEEGQEALRKRLANASVMDKSDAERELGEWKKALEEATNKNVATGLSQFRNYLKTVEPLRRWWEQESKKWGTLSNVAQAAENMVRWNPVLKGLTPESLGGELSLLRRMREEWVTTPRLTRPFSPESLGEVIGSWLQLGDLESAWSRMTPAFALTSDSDGGLSVYLDDRVEHETEAVRREETETRDAIVAQRDGFERESRTLRSEIEHLGNESAGLRHKFGLLDELVGSKLRVLEEHFAPILVEDERQALVDDGEKLREYLHLRKDQDARKDKTSMDIWTFLQIAFEKIRSARGELDRLLDRRERDDLSPVPGSIPVPRVPAEAKSLPGLFEDGAFSDLGETAEATPIDGEGTRIVPNPMLAGEQRLAAVGLLGNPAEGGNGEPHDSKTTQTMTRNPLEIARLDEVRGPKPETRSERGDEPTVQTGNGRERRETQRGIGAVQVPHPEEVTLPPAAATGLEDEVDPDDEDDEIAGVPTAVVRLDDIVRDSDVPPSGR